MSRFSLRTMAEIGVMVAIALVLNFFRLFQMPQGGSVSLEMLPIFIVALRWGTLPGVIAGALFGVAQLFFGASIYYPLQVIPGLSPGLCPAGCGRSLSPGAPPGYRPGDDGPLIGPCCIRGGLLCRICPGRHQCLALFTGLQPDLHCPGTPPFGHRRLFPGQAAGLLRPAYRAADGVVIEQLFVERV